MTDSCSVNSPRRTLSLSKKRRASLSFPEPVDKASGFGLSGEHGPKPAEVCGFVGSITTVAATVIYFIWAYVPESWLHSVGISYFPSRNSRTTQTPAPNSIIEGSPDPSLPVKLLIKNGKKDKKIPEEMIRVPNSSQFFDQGNRSLWVLSFGLPNLFYGDCGLNAGLLYSPQLPGYPSTNFHGYDVR
ncbi:hypothetical protein Ancab_006828 [Ancistrocladus abbreviatus]